MEECYVFCEAESGIKLQVNQSQILSQCKVGFLILTQNCGSFYNSTEFSKVEMSFNPMCHGYFRCNAVSRWRI